MAWVLGSLGDALKAAGDRTAARTAWRQALAIFDHLGPVAVLGPGPGFPDADQVQAKLTVLDERE